MTPPSLPEMIARLEAAAEGSRELDIAIWDAVEAWPVCESDPTMRVAPNGSSVGSEIFAPAYTTSLDAALSLVPPRHRWLIDAEWCSKHTRTAKKHVDRGSACATLSIHTDGLRRAVNSAAKNRNKGGMPRFYKGIGVGTFLHSTDLRATGIAPRSPGIMYQPPPQMPGGGSYKSRYREAAV